MPTSFCTPFGFTLIELMITLTIVAILLAIGLPQMREFIADQRVRAAISDIHGDLLYARADALGNQRRVVVAVASGSNWSAGWSVCVASGPTSYECSSQILRKSQQLGGQLKSCTLNDGLAKLAFRPDGSLDAAGFTGGNNDFIRVSDDMGDAGAGNDKIRTLYFAPMGRRMHVERENGGLN